MTAERWAVLRSLFEQTCVIPKDEREAFLNLSCGDDPTLRDSLLLLLDHHEAATSVLNGPMLTPDRLVEIVSSGIRTFVSGELVADRFRIVRYIAEGGMGEVYAAEDLELGGMVALKTIRPRLASDKDILSRFKREILLARKVTHRNVSRIFDLFRWKVELDNRSHTIVFVSMELLEGETLADRIQRLGALRIKDAEDVAMQLIAGIQAAHSVGIIHTDLKSGNIALVPDPNGGERAVIMDFGLAGTRNSLKDENRSGLIGTPAFMAPEQVENGPIVPATDLYALGIVLFQMVSGVLPFGGASAMEIAQRRLTEDPPLLRDTSPGVPLVWERAIVACLKRNPAERPQSATQVAAILTESFSFRRRSGFVAASTLAAILLSSGWFWIRQPYHPSPAAQAAVDDALVKLRNHSPEGFHGAIVGLQRAIQIDPKWSEPWGEIAYTYAEAANTSQVSASTAMIEARKAALHAVQLDSRSARALGALGWVQSLDLDEWPKAESSLRHAVSLSPMDSRLHYWLGVHLRKRGEFPQAEEQDKQALLLSHQIDPQIWCELAFLYWTSGRIDRMQTLMTDLLVAYPNFGLARFLNARMLKEQGRFEEALVELQVSESLHYSPVTVLAERASVEARQGKTAAALNDLRWLEEISKTKPVDGLLIAGVYVKLGYFDAAFEALEGAYTRRDSTLLSVATSPLLSPLRTDPRFKSLLRRLRFSP